MSKFKTRDTVRVKKDSKNNNRYDNCFFIKDNPKYKQLLEIIQEILVNTSKAQKVSILSNFDDLINQLNYDIFYCNTNNGIAANILDITISKHVNKMKQIQFSEFYNVLYFIENLYDLGNKNIYNISFTEMVEFNKMANNFILYINQFYCKYCGDRIDKYNKIISYTINDNITVKYHESCYENYKKEE